MNALAPRFSTPRLQRLLATAVGLSLLLPVALPSALAKPKKAAKVEAVTGPKVDPKAEAIAKHHRMAEIFLEAKSNDLAAEQAREVLKLDKKHLEARRILIAALGRMGKHDEALAVVDAPGQGHAGRRLGSPGSLRALQRQRRQGHGRNGHFGPGGASGCADCRGLPGCPLAGRPAPGRQHQPKRQAAGLG
jgi:hypothetical protein